MLATGKGMQTREHTDIMAPRHIPEKTAKAFNSLGLVHIQNGNVDEAGIYFQWTRKSTQPMQVPGITWQCSQTTKGNGSRDLLLP